MAAEVNQFPQPGQKGYPPLYDLSEKKDMLNPISRPSKLREYQEVRRSQRKSMFARGVSHIVRYAPI